MVILDAVKLMAFKTHDPAALPNTELPVAHLSPQGLYRVAFCEEII